MVHNTKDVLVRDAERLHKSFLNIRIGILEELLQTC